MRVIHIAPTVFGAEGLFGGGERYPLELARALARRVECRLVTFGTTTYKERDSSGLEVHVRPIRVRLKRHPAHPLGPFRSALKGADLIHAHQMRAAPTRLAALGARLRGRPVVVTDHGLLGGDWFGALPRLFDAFLTVSEDSARRLGAPAAKTRVVYGGCDPQRFAPDPSIRREGLLFVGRLTPHKGVDVLLRALPDDVPLTIAGSHGHDPRPPERDYPRLLRHLARDKDVRFVQDPSDGHLAALYRTAQAFVLPSVERTYYGKPVAISELLSLATIEAMASGTPVVCSRVGGVPEVVDHERSGYLVTPGDVEELRARLEDIVANPRRAEEMGRAGRALALERFTWDACAERCLAVYEELIGPT